MRYEVMFILINKAKFQKKTLDAFRPQIQPTTDQCVCVCTHFSPIWQKF